jgi:hypothetical protein
MDLHKFRKITTVVDDYVCGTKIKTPGKRHDDLPVSSLAEIVPDWTCIGTRASVLLLTDDSEMPTIGTMSPRPGL